jgi:hypothetical protein
VFSRALAAFHKQAGRALLLAFLPPSLRPANKVVAQQSTNLAKVNFVALCRVGPLISPSGRVWHTDSPFFLHSLKKTRLVSKFQAAVYYAEL